MKFYSRRLGRGMMILPLALSFACGASEERYEDNSKPLTRKIYVDRKPFGDVDQVYLINKETGETRSYSVVPKTHNKEIVLEKPLATAAKNHTRIVERGSDEYNRLQDEFLKVRKKQRNTELFLELLGSIIEALGDIE